MSKRSKTIIIVAVVVILAAAAGIFWYRTHRNDKSVAQTTSKSPTAQDDYSDGNDRSSNSGNDSSQGGAIDTGGTDAPKTEIGITSESGLVTVSVPSKNDTVKNGSVVAGTVKSGVTKVQYRLIDEQYGVLAQGSLDVVNNAFSGKLQFSPRSDSGRLDIFSFDEAGTEVNNIEIPVGLSK